MKLKAVQFLLRICSKIVEERLYRKSLISTASSSDNCILSNFSRALSYRLLILNSIGLKFFSSILWPPYLLMGGKSMLIIILLETIDILAYTSFIG